MERIKRILKIIFNPPIWITISLLILSFVLLFLLCFCSLFKIALAYVSYSLWTYTLIICITSIIRIVKKSKDIYQNSDKKAVKLYRKYKEDLNFKITVGVIIGLAMNTFYVIFRLIMAAMYSSIWFLTLMFYYLVLAGLRGFLLYSLLRKTRNEKTDVMAYSFVSWMLLLLNCTLSGIVILTIKTNSGFSYPGYIIYVSAAYSFYAIISSIVNVVKFKKIGNPILSSAKVLNLVCGMVSILALQTAMIAQFGGNDESFRILMNSLVGGVICIVVIVLAIYMIIHSYKLRKELKSNEQI